MRCVQLISGSSITRRKGQKESWNQDLRHWPICYTRTFSCANRSMGCRESFRLLAWIALQRRHILETDEIFHFLTPMTSALTQYSIPLKESANIFCYLNFFSQEIYCLLRSVVFSVRKEWRKGSTGGVSRVEDFLRPEYTLKMTQTLIHSKIHAVLHFHRYITISRNYSTSPTEVCF